VSGNFSHVIGLFMASIPQASEIIVTALRALFGARHLSQDNLICPESDIGVIRPRDGMSAEISGDVMYMLNTWEELSVVGCLCNEPTIWKIDESQQ
jgi:hypothetical protein